MKNAVISYIASACKGYFRLGLGILCAEEFNCPDILPFSVYRLVCLLDCYALLIQVALGSNNPSIVPSVQQCLKMDRDLWTRECFYS